MSAVRPGLGPLRGTRVIEVSGGYSAPGAGLLLAQLGADVVKIEPPGGEAVRYGRMAGSDLRFGADDRPADLTEPSWLALNRGKRSLVVDLKRPEGAELVRRLCGDADVLIHNMRPGKMEKLGLGYDDLAERNPRLIYCEQSGYGPRGPLARRAGADMWLQAFTGMVRRQGSERSAPRLAGLLVVDHAAMALVAMSILAAVVERERTGRGCHVSTSLLQAALFMQTAETASFLVDGRLSPRSGRGWMANFPYGAYRARDREVVIVAGFGDEWPTLCRVLGLDSLREAPGYSSHAERVARREELYPVLDDAFGRRDAQEWAEIFRAHGMRCEVCLDHDELVAHEQTQVNGLVEELDDPHRGRIRGLAFPATMDFRTLPPLGPAPDLGQHTDAVLSDAGFTDDEIRRLRDAGAVS